MFHVQCSMSHVPISHVPALRHSKIRLTDHIKISILRVPYIAITLTNPQIPQTCKISGLHSQVLQFCCARLELQKSFLDPGLAPGMGSAVAVSCLGARSDERQGLNMATMSFEMPCGGLCGVRPPRYLRYTSPVATSLNQPSCD